MRRTLLISLSVTSDSDLTANLSPALRAARVNAYCPSKAAVRALNCMAVIRVKTGDGLRPAGITATLRSPDRESAAHDIRSLAII